MWKSWENEAICRTRRRRLVGLGFGVVGGAFGDDFGSKGGWNGLWKWAIKKTIAMGREKPYKNRPFAPVLMVKLKAELPEGRGGYEQNTCEFMEST